MAERIAVDLEVNDKTADGIRSAISNANHLRISFEQAGDSMDRFESSLATTRHALYDLSSAYGRAGAATTAVLAATVGASAQFDVWNKASGRVLQGLVNRRSVERTLFDKT